MRDPQEPFQGLSAAEAAARLLREGANELPRARRRGPARIVLEVLREPMLALLLGAGLVYLALGDTGEALILLAFACLSVAITVVQEARTERVLEALRDLTSPRALVIRDGARQRIAGREVVRGDLLLLAEGDRVPADARLLRAEEVMADESLLTGEAVPVRKRAGEGDAALRPGGEDLPLVFSGSLIVRGTALAEVTATGAQSEIGKIGASLSTLELQTPHLQQQMRRLVLVFAALGGVVSLAVVVLYGLLRGGWLEAALAGIAVGMSMLPEEFPVVLAVFMAMGAWRISQARVLTRRAAAIEALGAASVLCTDKTGTLTENRMTIAALQLPDGETFMAAPGLPPPAAFAALAEAGTAASAPQPFDPMERAFHALAPPPGDGTLARSYALGPDLLAMTQIWDHGTHLHAYAKGAPEAIARLCGLRGAAQAALLARVEALAGAGLRVLGLAEADCVGDLPDSQHGFDFRFLGLAALADPLRPEVPAAVAECHGAGIRVIMITGDYPATARAVAQAAGIADGRVLTGDKLAAMRDDELAAVLPDTTVFARILPEQKLRIVNALKAEGAIVAMTGDGVNDAPSLKAADIGVAMGGRGTDVAREAAAIVLLDDDFGSIVRTVRLGRRINDNLRKAMRFILAVHVPIAGLALMPLLLGLPLLFGPVHVAFLEMVIDPVCSLVFEAEREERDVMRRPPRRANEPLFSAGAMAWATAQGALAFAAVGAVMWFAPGLGLDALQVRGLTFASLVLAIVALILVNRTGSASPIEAMVRPNRAIAAVLPLVAMMLGIVLFWAPAQAMFGFAALPGAMLAIPPLVAVALLLALEALKALRRQPGGI
ncbi:MAG: cation-translocating P-type ATPase [Rhodobacteraceae bacterium]|nr:cation-translocating P-type ATPase [Paracoccaceae bacterium]